MKKSLLAAIAVCAFAGASSAHSLTKKEVLAKIRSSEETYSAANFNTFSGRLRPASEEIVQNGIITYFDFKERAKTKLRHGTDTDGNSIFVDAEITLYSAVSRKYGRMDILHGVGFYVPAVALYYLGTPYYLQLLGNRNEMSLGYVSSVDANEDGYDDLLVKDDDLGNAGGSYLLYIWNPKSESFELKETFGGEPTFFKGGVVKYDNHEGASSHSFTYLRYDGKNYNEVAYIYYDASSMDENGNIGFRFMFKNEKKSKTTESFSKYDEENDGADETESERKKREEQLADIIVQMESLIGPLSDDWTMPWEM